MKSHGLRPLHLFGLMLIIGFAIYGATGLKGAITPYVSIEEAQKTADRVQVKGKLDKETIKSDSMGRLIFQLHDFKSAQPFTVIFTGQHPANMQMARDVVAMGKWDAARGNFEADQMNIKCPDKYAAGAGAKTD